MIDSSRLCQKSGLTLSGHAALFGFLRCPPKGQTPFLTEPSSPLIRRLAPAQLLWFLAVISLASVIAGVLGAGSLGAAEPIAGDRATPQGRLDLFDGGFVSGQLQPTEQEGTLRWQAVDFTEPLEFELQAVRQITIGAADGSPPPQREFACVLTSGGCIYGSLIGLTADDVALQTSLGQRLRIDRQHIERLTLATPQVRRSRRISIDDPGRRKPWGFDSAGRAIPDVKVSPIPVAAPIAAPNPVAPQIVERGNDPFGPANDPFGQPPIDARPVPQPAAVVPAVRAREAARPGLARRPLSASGDFVDLALQEKCLLELDVAWTDSLQLNLAIGIEHAHESLKQATRLAVWDGELVLARELDSRLSLVSVLAAKELAAARRLQLKIALEQSTGRVLIRDRSGNLLAELPAAEKQQPSGRGVRLFVGNHTQVTHLSAISSSLEDSLAEPAAVDDSPHVVLSTGEVITGAIEQFIAASGTVAVRQQDGAKAVLLSEIRQIRLAAPPDPPEVNQTPEQSAAPVLHRVVTADGWYCQGKWLGVQGDHLRLQVAGIEEPLHIPLQRLESISSNSPQQADHAFDPAGAKHMGRLVNHQMLLLGHLVPSDPDENPAELRWHPSGSLNAAPLHRSIDAQIDYAANRPANRIDPQLLTQQGRQRPGGALRVFKGDVMGDVEVDFVPALELGGLRAQPARRVVVRGGIVTAPANPAEVATTLFLRSGDTITCEITQVDERGISFSSASAMQGFARHDQVKSVILAGLVHPKQISEATRRRLLMVPRMQRDDPPTHLICSRGGDFIRGRLLSLDEHSLRIEVRLETRVIPRDRIAQIFWMHPDELPQEDAAAPAAADQPAAAGQAAAADQPAAADRDQDAGDAQPPAPQTHRVQALRHDGLRLAFDFRACRDQTTLVGHHEILGPCHVDLQQVDRLLLGAAIDRSLVDSPLAQWRLHHALIPNAFRPRAGDAQPGSAGTESTLVGKPAPEFELELLGGEPFRLAEQRGRVVVLDFWASWCGPCIQAMPQVDAVIREFPAADVRLVAVNLQEQPAAITAALQRMGLEVAVAMDRNGSVADQYGVTGIPQTVIIGPDGDVARLYVGINSSFADDLRGAIEALLAADEPEQPPEE